MRILTIIIFILSCSTIFGQEISSKDSVTNQVTYRIVEIIPTYKSDLKVFYEDMTKELNLGKDIFGSVWVNTWIDSNGTISVLEVEKSSVSPAVDSKIVNAINKLQGWTPGKTHDKVISTEFPIYLKIEKGKIRK
jgi:TonB family protein